MLREVSGFLFAIISSDFHAIRQFYAKQCRILCRAKRALFTFAQRSGAMKAPVGLLSDRTVLRKQDGEHPQLPDLSADAALPQGAGGGRFRPECLHRKRLPGLQQLPQNVPAAVWHHTRGVSLPEPEESLITERIERSKSSILDIKSSHLCCMANAKRGRCTRNSPVLSFLYDYAQFIRP